MWQPIETAPKEGRQMFVVKAIGIVFRDGAFPYNSDPYCVWRADDGGFARWPHHFKPTHWMPLPEAPEEPGAQAQPAPNDEYVGWYCAHCERGVAASEVTYHEQHEVCGRVITNDRPPKPAPSVPDDVLRRALLRISEDGWFMFLEDREVAPRMREIAREALEAAPEAQP